MAQQEHVVLVGIARPFDRSRHIIRSLNALTAGLGSQVSRTHPRVAAGLLGSTWTTTGPPASEPRSKRLRNSGDTGANVNPSGPGYSPVPQRTGFPPVL
jgi:hypothetical protein